MKLYYASGASSLCVHIALQEAELPVELIKVDIFTVPRKTEKGEDYLSINERGYVPALVLDNGEILTEEAAILQYIARKAPSKKLMPTEDMALAKAQEWLGYTGTEIQKWWGPIWLNFPEEVTTKAKERLFKAFSVLEKALTGKEYLVENRFTVVDAYMFNIVSWTIPLEWNMDAYPNIKAYVDRVANRPHVQAVLKKEGLPGAK